MATTPQSLLSAASCFACYAGNEYALRLMRLALIRQWALAVDPSIDTSPEALLAYAKCYVCFDSAAPGNPYTLELYEIVLFDRILQASGGGGQNQGRITEEGEDRITEEGDRRFTEEL